MKITNSRKVYLDFLKVFGAFLVIYNHTEGFHYYLDNYNTPFRISVAIMLSSITRINVPLFFMISGALLLGKEESYRKLFLKRIPRFAAALCLASFALYATGNIPDFRVIKMIKDTLTCSVTGVYWFLFAYLGFLCSLPLLRKIAASITGKELFLIVAGRVLISGIPVVLKYVSRVGGWYYLSIPSYFTLPFSQIDIFFYPLVGFYLDRHVSFQSIRKALPVLLLCILGDTLLSCGITYQNYVMGERTQGYLGIFCYLSAASVFLIAKYIFESENSVFRGERLTGLIAGVSTLTLGIYLIDPFVKERMGLYAAMDRMLGEVIPCIPLSVIYCFASMAIGASVTWLLKKLPVIKNIL